MVPSVVVELERLPVNANGKLDRGALPAPESAGAEVDETPVGPVEELTAGIFAEVLKREAVPRGGGFFELGGHSLTATQVMARLREAFRVELPLR